MRRVIIENVLALVITLGFFGVIAGYMLIPPAGIDPSIAATVNQLIGALTVAFAGVVSYFFGSSTSSKQKDDTITAMTVAAAAPTNGKNGHTPPASKSGGGSEVSP